MGLKKLEIKWRKKGPTIENVENRKIKYSDGTATSLNLLPPLNVDVMQQSQR